MFKASQCCSDAQTYLNQYNVDYVFVGDKEREAYGTLDIESLQNLGEVIFRDGETFIIER